MGIQEFIGEVEAAQMAGVTTKTLKRFTEAGYLKPETDNDGFLLYSKNELSSLFKISNTTKKVVPIKPTSRERIFTNNPTPTLETPSAESVESPTMNHSANGSAALKIEPQAEEVTSEEVAPKVESTPLSHPILELKEENERLKSLLDLNEQLLDNYEKQIKDGAREREWLRGQIDSLNERLSRDQVLLLTQTQTISQMITHQYNRPSLVQRVMGLIGFSEDKSK